MHISGSIRHLKGFEVILEGISFANFGRTFCAIVDFTAMEDQMTFWLLNVSNMAFYNFFTVFIRPYTRCQRTCSKCDGKPCHCMTRFSVTLAIWQLRRHNMCIERTLQARLVFSHFLVIVLCNRA